jgi:predicted DNA-binding antitoxin AbrB/MazE fold protein
MPQSIIAVHEHGLLRPLEPLTLPESFKVRIQIVPEPIVEQADQAIQSLVKASLLTPPSNPSNPSKATLIPKDERRKLADALAQGAKKTLSEIVIEDRGQW